MAKHTKFGKPNKNLFMHITNNPGYSNKASRKWTEDNTQNGYTDDSKQHPKYMAKCESLKQMIDDIRNDQTEVVKKLDILESRRRTAMAGCKSRHCKQISGHEEASSSASSTLAHTSDKGDSGLAERLRMLEHLRRTHTSLIDDNRVTNIENTSEYNKSLVVQTGSHKRKPQARELRRFKTDTKEDNRIVSCEAQIEHVRDKKNSQSRTQAKEVTRHSQDDHFPAMLHKNKTETKTEILSTEESMTKLRTYASEDIMPKSKKMSTAYSMKVAVKSQLDSKMKQALGRQCKTITIDEEQMKNMMQPDGTIDFKLAFQTITKLANIPELPEHIQNAYTLELSGNGFPCMNMSTLTHSNELDFAYLSEYEDGKKHRESGNSVETIICLDTSESMKGPLWTKAITFAKKFIQEVKNQPCGDSSVFERIGLVTFGHVTRVQVHLTRHYQQVLSKLDTLSPSGSKPMMSGLKMCKAAFRGAGARMLEMNTMGIFPRIILVTDGKTTSHLQEGPNVSVTVELDELSAINTVEEIKKNSRVHIDCVPLGESKIDFLTRIAQITRGKIYQCEDWKKLGRRTKYLDIASRHYQDFLSRGNISFVRGVIGTRWNIKEEDLGIIEESMRRSKEFSKESKEEEHFSRERTNRLEDQLLQIGTRVRRGPDWDWGDQDSQGVGTLVGYDKNGWVKVVWDNCDSRGRNSNSYMYAIGGNFDVLSVEEQRVLLPGERIAVGCKVKRGKDWISGDQDGGPDNVGTVIKTGDRSEKVTVHWPNQKSHKYKFGKKGRYEVQLCDTHESYIYNIMAEKETESVEMKLLKEIDHPKVKQKIKDVDVEEMNRRNIEMSKGYITLSDSGGCVKESPSLKPEDSKVKMDTEVTTLEHQNIKKNKNRR